MGWSRQKLRRSHIYKRRILWLWHFQQWGLNKGWVVYLCAEHLQTFSVFNLLLTSCILALVLKNTLRNICRVLYFAGYTFCTATLFCVVTVFVRLDPPEFKFKWLNCNVMGNHLNLQLKFGHCSVENCALWKTKLPQFVDKVSCLSGTGYGLISFGSFDECGIFEKVMTMQWHFTLVTLVSCRTSLLICSTHCTGFGEILFACGGRNLLCQMDPFLYLDCCLISTNWHPSCSVVNLWCHIFKNVSGLCACVCSYSYIFLSLCSGLWLCWKEQCPSYERLSCSSCRNFLMIRKQAGIWLLLSTAPIYPFNSHTYFHLIPSFSSIVWTFPLLSSCFLFFVCSSFLYSHVQMMGYKHHWDRVMSQLINHDLIFCLLHHFLHFLY